MPKTSSPRGDPGDWELEPPPPLPAVQVWRRTTAPDPGSRRRLSRRRRRTSAIAYVKPCRSGPRARKWEVDYTRNGFRLNGRWASRELCGWIATLAHELASPEIVHRHSVMEEIYVTAPETEVDGASLLWVNGTDTGVVVGVDPGIAGKLRGPWFFHDFGVFRCPVLKANKDKNIKVSWVYLIEEIRAITGRNPVSPEAFWVNSRGQVVFDWRTYPESGKSSSTD